MGNLTFAAVQHERKPVLGESAATKVGSRSPRVKPEPQPTPEVPSTWEQPESPSMEDQSSDSDALSDALTLARERLLLSHALADSMAKIIGDVSRDYYHIIVIFV